LEIKLQLPASETTNPNHYTSNATKLFLFEASYLDEATPGFIKIEDWHRNHQTAIQWITQFGTLSKKTFTLGEEKSIQKMN